MPSIFRREILPPGTDTIPGGWHRALIVFLYALISLLQWQKGRNKMPGRGTSGSTLNASESRAHFKASLTSLSFEVSSHIAGPEISAKNSKATFTATKSLSEVPRLKSGLASSVGQLMMLTSGDNSTLCP